MNELLSDQNVNISGNSTTFAIKIAKLLTLGKMNKFFCSRLIAALHPKTNKHI